MKNFELLLIPKVFRFLATVSDSIQDFNLVLMKKGGVLCVDVSKKEAALLRIETFNVHARITKERLHSKSTAKMRKGINAATTSRILVHHFDSPGKPAAS